MTMRRILFTAAIAALGAGLAACGSSGSGSGSGGSTTASPAAASCTYAGVQKELFTKGVLTVATDSPVYPPWFRTTSRPTARATSPPSPTRWPSSSASRPARSSGPTEPFDSSYAPGPKKFDFDVNEISVTPERATAVTFSDSYYDVQQALVALKGSPITTKHEPADLKTYVYGDQIGTTSLAFINSQIQPTEHAQGLQRRSTT